MIDITFFDVLKEQVENSSLPVEEKDKIMEIALNVKDKYDTTQGIRG